MGLLILRAVSWPLAKSSSQQISNAIGASFYQGRPAPWGRPGILPVAPGIPAPWLEMIWVLSGPKVGLFEGNIIITGRKARSRFSLEKWLRAGITPPFH